MEKMDTAKLQRVSVSMSVSVVEQDEKKKKLIAAMASAVPPITVFHLVNLWTLINAFFITFACAYDLIIHTLVFPRYTTGEPMTTADADDLVRRTAILCCSAPQAVAGTLALLLPCHWRKLRRARTYAGLALTVAGNYILASAVRAAFLVDDPGNVFFRIGVTLVLFACGVYDLLGLMALVRGAGKEQEAYVINLADLFT